MRQAPFELCVLTDRPDEYGLALSQRRHAGNGSSRHAEITLAEGGDLVTRVYGTPLRAVMDQILLTLKREGYRSSDLSRSRKAPFLFSEAAGVRLGLLLLAIKPLRKPSRMADISQHLQLMTDEEAYYWFSKATSPRESRRYQKALRILLAKE